jgi:streptogramin lyase
MFRIKASLAAAVLLTALLVSSASAQYIYVANAGEDTVSKIDINTNTEVARYATWFTSGTNHTVHLGGPWTGAAPSRIARDTAGNVYVLDRFFTAHLPVLLKIVPTGGTLSTTTSSGPVLPMIDANNNNHIDSGEATDVRIKWASEIGAATDAGALGRSLCIDPSGFLWVGMHTTQRYYKVDPITGLMVGGPILTPGHRPYGCQVDTKGKLWSVDESQTLAEIDTVTNQVTIHNHATFGNNYSLSLFNGCGSASSKVYISEITSKTYIAYDPQTSSFTATPLPTSAQFGSLAIGVDSHGDIISGQRSLTGRVIKSHPNGTVVWDTSTVTTTNTVPAQDLRGIIIDEHDDVWAVHLRENRLVKYSGATGAWIATVPVGDSPYTYGNPPPPACPCAAISENPIRCEGQKGGTATYSWSFLFTNHSPFATPATAIDLSSSQVTNLTPAHFQFGTPVPVNGTATVSGTFTVANPVPGAQVCLDIRLNAGEGWCCPIQRVCFFLPDCPTCAKLQGEFVCQHGHPVLQLSVTNLGPTAAQSVQVTSNTPGVTVAPQMTTGTFPPNTPVTIPLTVTGATAGQTISLTVNLEGPIDPKTGVNTWCCTATVTVTYPKVPCNGTLDGWVFNDLNRDGNRDSEEEGLSGWTATLTAVSGGGNALTGNITYGTGTPRTTNSDATGTYRFENVSPGTYRIAVQPARGWRSTIPDSGVYTVTVGGPPERKFDFGFVKVQP